MSSMDKVDLWKNCASELREKTAEQTLSRNLAATLVEDDFLSYEGKHPKFSQYEFRITVCIQERRVIRKYF